MGKKAKEGIGLWELAATWSSDITRHLSCEKAGNQKSWNLSYSWKTKESGGHN